jgi:hypothetical protein
MLLDPVIRADYQNRARQAGLASAYSAALTDYLKAPKINAIDTDYFKGAVGDVIWIVALDDFKIQRLTVTIQRWVAGAQREGSPDSKPPPQQQS